VKQERVGVDDRLARYPLLDALRERCSRCFGMGMNIGSGPFAYESHHEPLPLTETEEAALAFAACGVAGYALADLSYGRGQGGGMLAGLRGVLWRARMPSTPSPFSLPTTKQRTCSRGHKIFHRMRSPPW
jgi:hypothetical protein